MTEPRKQLSESWRHHLYEEVISINLTQFISKDRILQNKRYIEVSCKAQKSFSFPSLCLESRNITVVPYKQAFTLKTGATDNLFIATFNGQVEGGFLTLILKI